MKVEDVDKLAARLSDLRAFDNTEFECNLYRKSIDDKSPRICTDTMLESMRHRVRCGLRDAQRAERQVIIDELAALGVEVE